MEKKKVLLLGGTGAMGIYIVPELIKRNYDVYVSTRNDRVSNEHSLTYLRGNAHDESFIETQIKKGWDVIIDFMVYNTAEFQRKHETYLNYSKHYIFISSYRVFSNFDYIISEKTPKLLNVIDDSLYLSTDEYALSKARQENILRCALNKNWTIIRPSITYSKNRFQLGTLEADSIIFRSKNNLPILFPREMLKKETTMTWAGDVARMISPLLLNEKTFAEDYNVVTNEHTKWEDILKIYKETLNIKVIETDLETYIQAVGNNYQVKYDRMYNRMMDNNKILEISKVNNDSLMNLKEGLTKEIMNFLNNPKEFPINYSLQGRMDKILNTNIPLKQAKVKDKIKYFIRKHIK